MVVGKTFHVCYHFRDPDKHVLLVWLEAAVLRARLGMVCSFYRLLHWTYDISYFDVGFSRREYVYCKNS